MEVTPKKSIHPLIAVAAVSVTLFSLAGIAAVTGLIPTSHSQSAAQMEPAKPAEEPAKVAVAPQAADTSAATTESEAKAAEEKEAAHKEALHQEALRKEAARKAVERKRAEAAERKARAAAETAKLAKAETQPAAPAAIAQSGPPPGYAPPPTAASVKPLCHDCGVVESVREVEKPGKATGSGAAIGGIAGAILGNQTGRGHGRDVMTVLGALGGAIAGHEIEQKTAKVKAYEIGVRFDDGSTQLITQDTPPAWRSGDHVKVVNGVITANNEY